MRNLIRLGRAEFTGVIRIGSIAPAASGLLAMGKSISNLFFQNLLNTITKDGLYSNGSAASNIRSKERRKELNESKSSSSLLQKGPSMTLPLPEKTRNSTRKF